MKLPHYETLEDYLPTNGIVLADIFADITWVLILKDGFIDDFYYIKNRFIYMRKISITRLLLHLKKKFNLKPNDIVYIDETEELIDIDVILDEGRLLTSYTQILMPKDSNSF